MRTEHELMFRCPWNFALVIFAKAHEQAKNNPFLYLESEEEAAEVTTVVLCSLQHCQPNPQNHKNIL